MLRYAIIIPALAWAMALTCAAQESSGGVGFPFGMAAGLHAGAAFFVEAGIGTAGRLPGGSCNPDGPFMGYTISGLFAPGLHSQAGVEGTMWFDAPLLDMGVNLAYFTDFTQATYRFKPEIGIGLMSARLVYSLSIPISNTRYSGIGTHEIALRAYIPVRKAGSER
jgi:hypothetical protein